MLSKIKSPSLAERHSPHGHHLRPHSKLHLTPVSAPQDLSETKDTTTSDKDREEQKASKHTQDKPRATQEEPIEMDDNGDDDDDDLESQHTATDLVIDHGGADEPSQCDLPAEEEPKEVGAESKSESSKSIAIKEEAKPEQQQDIEPRDEQVAENHDNNNNDDNNNNNNNNGDDDQRSQQQNGKQTQLELLHIIETSRKRRLSKDSADSLSSFIRWSFSHFDATAIFGPLAQRKSSRRHPQQQQKQQQQQPNGVITRHHNHHRQSNGSEQSDITKDEEEDEEEDGEEEDLTIANEELANDADHELQQSDEDEEQAADLRRQANGVTSSQRRQQFQQHAQHRSREIELARERLFRARVAKLAAAGGGNSTLSGPALGQQQQNAAARQQVASSQQQQAATNLSMAMKRSRQAAAYSPEPQAKVFSPAAKTSPNSNQTQLGFVVDRLNQQQQRQSIKSLDFIANQLGAAGAIKRQQQHQAFSRHREDLVVDPDELDPAESPAAASGLSLQLQQFLQQQQLAHQQQQSSPLDDLMLDAADELSPGSGGSGARQSQSQQLALAAAIHRALLNNNNNQDHPPQSKSNISPSANQSGGNQSNSAQQQQVSSSSFLVDSLSRQQQQQQQGQGRTTRAYNTRGLAQAAANLASNRLQQQQMAISNRVALMQQHQQQQQQRHAQAAAALSVLANGANPTALHHFAAAAAAAASGGPAAHLGGSSAPSSNGFPHHNHAHAHHHQHHLGRNGPGGHAPSSTMQVNVGTPTNQALASPVAAASLVALANQTEFKCDTCPSSFDDRHRLMQHQSIHLELKKDWFTETPVEEVMKIFNRRRGEFLCNLCNLRFEATLDYDQHNHQVHGPRPYCCQFCGNGTRTFKCWRQYLNHLYDHRYIFSCTIGDCDFTVNRRDSLRFHIFRFHLNCQLPQNQQVTPTNGFKSSSSSQLSPYNLSQNGGLTGGSFGDQNHLGGAGGGGGGGGGAGNPLAYLQQHHLQKWSGMMGDDEGEDTENEMNVAD